MGPRPWRGRLVPHDAGHRAVTRGILQLLAGFGPARFVDLIIDVLVIEEKHTLIDRTDGPGDEK